MLLLLFWIIFISLMSYGCFFVINDLFYFLCSFCMLCITYVYNLYTPKFLSFKNCIIFLTIPSFIMCYIAEKYNSFLSLDPFTEETVVILLCLYWYLLIYIISEFD